MPPQLFWLVYWFSWRTWITRPLMLVSSLPTRNGLPLAMGLIFVGLFVVLSRKKALTQIIGFLVLENGIVLLAALGTYGIPLIVELGCVSGCADGFPSDASPGLSHSRYI